MAKSGLFVCKKTSENVLGSQHSSWFASTYDQTGDYGSYVVSCKPNGGSRDIVDSGIQRMSK